ncbi:MAG: hypothetical protein EKK48_20825 [Candidatus Melainabacteria bacterium]|nr:MAG: hypothetical protein EKK48_20825 [Candidatus Melainabacteria bacterium]
MGDPAWRGPSDGFGSHDQKQSQWTRLQEELSYKFIDQIASAPSPSDRLAEQRRQAAANQSAAAFDNVGAPGSATQNSQFHSTNFGAFDGTKGVRPFTEITGHNQTGQFAPQRQFGPQVQTLPQLQTQPRLQTQPELRRPDVPVLRGDPSRPAPEYPGGIGPDARMTGAVISSMGGGPRVLWEMFTRTYNSRAKENVLPGQLPLVEVAPQALAKIDHWMLMGDSDMSQPRAEYGNRNLRPGPEQKGNVFAVGVNKEGNPINVLEYYWGDKQMIYAGQYQISYSKDNYGLMHSRIDHYKADQPGAIGPRAVIGSSVNVYEGTTEYVSNDRNQMLSVRKFDYINPNVPEVGVEFDSNGAHKIWRDGNSGTLREQAVAPNMVRQTVDSLSNHFYFRNLYGP